MKSPCSQPNLAYISFLFSNFSNCSAFNYVTGTGHRRFLPPAKFMGLISDASHHCFHLYCVHIWFTRGSTSFRIRAFYLPALPTAGTGTNPNTPQEMLPADAEPQSRFTASNKLFLRGDFLMSHHITGYRQGRLLCER